MESNGRINSGTAIMMIQWAILIDVLQFGLTFIFIGLILGPIISFIATILFGIWFSHHGISMLSPKNALRFGATVLGEIALSALPVWTVAVAYTIWESQKNSGAQAASPTGPSWRL